MKTTRNLSNRPVLSTLGIAVLALLALPALSAFEGLAPSAFEGLAPSAAEGSQSEQEVRAVMDLYFKGAATAEPSYFEEAFDVENGHMKSIGRSEDGTETVRTTPIPAAIDGWTRHAPEKSWGKVLNVDVIDDRLAHATVELLWRGTIYVDVMGLYKVNDQWKIVNKTFVSRGRAE
jgi:hypothetical protein